MTLTLVTPPATNVVAMSDIYDALVMDVQGSPPEPENASTITRYRDAAEAYLDGPGGVLGRALVTQTWRLDLNGFPSGGRYVPGMGHVDCGAIVLPLPPLQSVSSITFVDTNGDTQTLATSVYQVVNRQRQPSMIVEAYGQSWPSTRDIYHSVSVTFIAGYGAAADVPSDIARAIELLVGDMDKHRSSSVVGRAVAELPALGRLIDKYRVGLVV